MTVQATDRGGKAATPPIELTPIIVISIGIFVTTFDMTAVIMVMPKIKETMNLDIGGFAWVMDSYSLAFTVFLMTAGVLADRYGRRRAMLVGNATFLGASVLCGFAQDEVVLLIGRVAQGIGAAFIVCSGLALVGHRYSERSESARAFALLGSISGGAMALGPAGGGMVADLLGWQWVFFINIPICLFVAFGLPRVLAESSDPARRRIDTLGLLALSSFLVSAVWFLLHGSRVGTVVVPVWLTLGWVAALAGLFLLTQRRAAQPLLELGLFSSRSFLGTCLVPLALSLGYWAVLVYLPLFLQERLGRSLNETSYAMLAATLPMVMLPMFGARIALALRPGIFFSTGLLVVAAGCGVIAIGAELGNLAVSLVGMTVAGAGTAVLHSQVSGAIVGLVAREQAGAASAVTVMLRQGGFALGIALLAGVLRMMGGGEPGLVLGANPYTVLFCVAGACAVVSALVVFLLIAPKVETK